MGDGVRTALRRLGSGSLLPALWLAVLVMPVPPPAAAPSPGLAVAVPHRVQVRPPAVRQPFPGRAGDALQIVSVVAPSVRNSSGHLTLWERAAVGLPWRRASARVPVWLGSAGLSRHPREGRAKTPIGSFTLHRAYGRDPNLGGHLTQLPYHQLRSGEGWNTAPGPHYNRLGHTGELYAGRNSWARALVLIDYNVTHPRSGAGSGFFLHVSSGRPTHGCVAVPRAAMMRLLRWLDPNAAPRVVIDIRR